MHWLHAGYTGVTQGLQASVAGPQVQGRQLLVGERVQPSLSNELLLLRHFPLR